ncbi:MAG: HIT family protein [Deltaproteobacteria bacterium]|nr:HIT family protein [Deltaproteobacteria bacterium]
MGFFRGAAVAVKARDKNGRAPKDDCAFCKVIQGKAERYAVLEDEVSLAFLDRRPLFPGHCLLIPKEHYETLIDVPSPLIAPLFANAKLLAQALEEALDAEGSFLAINNRVSQSVPHLHIHIVPRKKKDGLRGFFWPRQRYPDENSIVQIQNAVRAAADRLKSSR